MTGQTPTGPTTAIVLAGGLGTRLRAAVPDLPKPMAPINGRPFLEHLMDYWMAQGITRFILSVGYKHDAISGHFGNTYKGCAIAYSVEETPMGTGGGLLMAMQKLPDTAPFLLLNGDTYFAVPLPALAQFYNNNKADWAFSLFETTDTQRYMGMDVAADGRIKALKATEGATAKANGGVYMVNPQALKTPLGRYSLEADMFPALMAEDSRFYGIVFSGTFIDIGVPADYKRAGDLIG